MLESGVTLAKHLVTQLLDTVRVRILNLLLEFDEVQCFSKVYSIFYIILLGDVSLSGPYMGYIGHYRLQLHYVRAMSASGCSYPGFFPSMIHRNAGDGSLIC